MVRILYLKTLPQPLNSTPFIKVKPLELCLACSLVQKKAASFCGKIKIIAVSLFVACLINHL